MGSSRSSVSDEVSKDSFKDFGPVLNVFIYLLISHMVHTMHDLEGVEGQIRGHAVDAGFCRLTLIPLRSSGCHQPTLRAAPDAVQTSGEHSHWKTSGPCRFSGLASFFVFLQKQFVKPPGGNLNCEGP